MCFSFHLHLFCAFECFILFIKYRFLQDFNISRKCSFKYCLPKYLFKKCLQNLYGDQMFLFFRICFWHFCLLFDRTVGRQEMKLERERGDGIGIGPRAGTRTRDAQSTTALHVDALPTRLSAPTKMFFSIALQQTPQTKPLFWRVYGVDRETRCTSLYKNPHRATHV